MKLQSHSQLLYLENVFFKGWNEMLTGEESLWYWLHPSTCSVLWKICLQHCIFWRKRIGPFALRLFTKVIHGMRNSLGNGSLAFEFHFHFYFWQSLRAAFELPFTSLSQHHSFPRLCSEFQEPDPPICCPSEYIKPDLFSSMRNEYYTSE